METMEEIQLKTETKEKKKGIKEITKDFVILQLWIILKISKTSKPSAVNNIELNIARLVVLFTEYIFLF